MPPGFYLSYLLPMFTSLFFLMSKNRETRFHALQCALIDALTVGYMIAYGILGAVYSAIRYGGKPISDNDPLDAVTAIIFMVLPLALRGFCLVKLVRHNRPFIKYLGALASRLAYRERRGQWTGWPGAG
ncbi:hypothetical protein [Actinomadura sp. DC4]|uniref:hypothetical protein n=1 Tax=Actinomadura sp. DC4 TaxID=3055069 RepID=UPI0025AFE781|nr:hypothetical protein [Actinomadura sp. DC4]MDN3354029.1 hypothetical protein [Actinomadura sp. DC4]